MMRLADSVLRGPPSRFADGSSHCVLTWWSRDSSKLSGVFSEKGTDPYLPALLS